MGRQGAPSLPSIPPASDPGFSNPEHIIIAFLKILGGPYLLCEQKIRGSLQALRSLAPATLKSRKKSLVTAQEFSTIIPVEEVPAIGPEAPGSNSTANWIDVDDLLNNGKAYYELFESTLDIAHLDEALQLGRLALNLCSAAHPLRGAVVLILASYLSERYNQGGDVVDLTGSIGLWAEWLVHNPLGHPERGKVLNDLSRSLFLHYMLVGNLKDLQDAIPLLQESLELSPEGHPMRTTRLNNLACIFCTYYGLTGDLESLEGIIALQRESLDLCKPGDPGRGACLNNLACFISIRYDLLGNPADLKDAITLGTESLNLHPPGHPTRGRVLSNLSVHLGKQYHLVGDLEDHEGAIRLRRESLELHPPGHPFRDYTLSNLGEIISERYDRTGNVADLEEAIALQRESLNLRSVKHPARCIKLGNLTETLTKRFTRMGHLEDLEDAIKLQRENLELCPPGHSSRYHNLNNLSVLLARRHCRTGSLADIEEAINIQRESLELCPQGHPLRADVLNNLAIDLTRRCDLTNNVDDLVEAIKLQRESLDWCPRGNPKRASLLIHLAQFLLDHIHLTRTLAGNHNFSELLGIITPQSNEASEPVIIITMEAANELIELLQEAAHHLLSPIGERTRAANLWRRISRAGHPSELEAMQTTLNLMDLAVAESASLQSLSSRLSDEASFRAAQGVASDSAALAIGSGDLPLAVSLLEQGRSIIYSQLGRYRAAIDDVRRVSPDLAERLVGLSMELDALVIRGERINFNSNIKTKPFDDDTSRHYNARTAWIRTVEEVRQLPGLESFLLPSPFERLREAASKGPVIIVNINERRSDAIIIYSTGDLSLVPLPNASPDAIQDIVEGFGERPAECTPRKAISLLREIWAIIVEPVVTQLLWQALAGGSDKPRIWWCPTGVASKLPLHAAGPYVRGEKNLGHLFVSSYTPTLGTLIRARQSRGDNLTAKDSVRSILIVGQPDTPGENPLPQVVDEVEAIQRQVPHASVLLSSDGTKEAVLTGLCQNAWLHLACHGHYDTKQPFHSSFAMHDGGITLLELIGRDLPHAELAFLSACHSARASETLPDEALHPAAGMMFAGFKSVIGTMWAFDDGVGSALAGRFYELMVEGKKGYTDAAVVLADAMQDIVDEDKDAVPFMQRINIVHYGV